MVDYGVLDRRLVARVCGRDESAFQALYRRHATLVQGIARRVLGDAYQAEDITQSVFALLWARPESFRGGNFAAWLSRVARNASLDVVRSAYVRTREPELAGDVASDIDVEEEVSKKVEIDAVIAAVRALPPDERRAIELAYLRGMSYRQVSEHLRQPLGTVKSRIRTGLRRILGAHGKAA